MGIFFFSKYSLFWDKLWRQLGNHDVPLCFGNLSWYHDPQNSWRTPFEYKCCAHFACLAQRLSAFTSRCRTDKAGREALEPRAEDGTRTKRFDLEILVQRIPYWGWDENNSWSNPCPVKKMNNPLYVLFSWCISEKIFTNKIYGSR